MRVWEVGGRWEKKRGCAWEEGAEGVALERRGREEVGGAAEGEWGGYLEG